MMRDHKMYQWICSSQCHVQG